MTFSKIFFYCCIAFLFGVFLSSFYVFSFLFYFLFLILGIFFFFVFYKRNIAVVGICLLVFLFGIFWAEKFEREIFPKCDVVSKLQDDFEVCDIHYYNNKKAAFVEGIVVKDPQEKEKSVEVLISVQKINNKPTRGDLLAFLEIGNKVKYGDMVLLKGDLKTPENFTPDFNYKEYLRGKRIYSLVFRPELKVLSSGNGNPILERIFSFKRRLKDNAKILPLPEGAILSAITLGDKSRLSDNFKEKLSVSGLSHIVAISGMHIMIILEIFLLFLIWLGLWRREATIFSLVLLFFYILLIGAPASAIRAGIMGMFLYIGWAIGRLSQSSRSIVFAATGMVIFNPLILTRDVGFQLSFLAALGIIYFYPIFEKKFRAKGSKIKELICLTLAAQILCFPILIFNFGRVSVFAPFSNILVVPLLPILLISGFLFLILSVISSFLGLFLSFIVSFLFSWVVFVASFVYSLPFSSFSLKISGIFVLIFYVVVGIFILKRQRKLYQI